MIITTTLDTATPTTTWVTMTLDLATVTVTESAFPSVDPGNLPHQATYPLPPFSYQPSPAAGWVIGAMFGILMFLVVFVSFRGKTHVYFGGAVAAIFLMVSYFLRGAINSNAEDYEQLYWSSNILNAIGACLLSTVNFAIAAMWIEHISTNKGMSMGILGLSLLYAIVIVVIHPIGATKAFDSHNSTREEAQTILTASYSLTLAFNFLLALICIFYSVTDTAREFVAHITNLLTPALLISAWASYHLAAVNLPPNNVANTSEVLFYLLDALPLGLVLILWVIFNAPRLFNFDEKYYYSAYTRRHGHKHAPKIYHDGDPAPDDPRREEKLKNHRGELECESVAHVRSSGSSTRLECDHHAHRDTRQHSHGGGGHSHHHHHLHHQSSHGSYSHSHSHSYSQNGHSREVDIEVAMQRYM
ncbi:hypothetical protein H4219_002866 [Mycoemilia scoparia]|uniref:Uncharacterized protein n=1 Tax=Mycoemilia scoparia TaxID=417184 RepID=A0A9W7ZWE8_9FUNG|nr:hypothetical protein H4219_002866 [Mycoemilia scoparia]